VTIGGPARLHEVTQRGGTAAASGGGTQATVGGRRFVARGGVGSLRFVADDDMTADVPAEDPTAGVVEELAAIEADLAAVEAALAALDEGADVDLGDLPDDAPPGALAERLEPPA
jgi:hypothetical protein